MGQFWLAWFCKGCFVGTQSRPFIYIYFLIINLDFIDDISLKKIWNERTFKKKCIYCLSIKTYYSMKRILNLTFSIFSHLLNCLEIGLHITTALYLSCLCLKMPLTLLTYLGFGGARLLFFLLHNITIVVAVMEVQNNAPGPWNLIWHKFTTNPLEFHFPSLVLCGS